MSTNDLVAQAEKILSRFSSTPRFDATKCFSSAFIASSHASFIKPFHASRSDRRSFHLICMRNSSTRLDGNKCDSISLFLVPSSHTGSGTLKAPNASSAGILRHTKDPFPRYQLYSRTALCWWINRQMLDWATTAAGRKGPRIRDVSGFLSVRCIQHKLRAQKSRKSCFIRFDYKPIYGFHLLFVQHFYVWYQKEIKICCSKH